MEWLGHSTPAASVHIEAVFKLPLREVGGAVGCGLRGIREFCRCLCVGQQLEQCRDGWENSVMRVSSLYSHLAEQFGFHQVAPSEVCCHNLP